MARSCRNSASGPPRRGQNEVKYEEVQVDIGGRQGGEAQRPTYTIADLAYGPLHSKTMISPRVAPQMIGLGLLEGIPEEPTSSPAPIPMTPMATAFPGAPIGRLVRRSNAPALGRFGWKAGSRAFCSRAAEAIASDVGISPLYGAKGLRVTARRLRPFAARRRTVNSKANRELEESAGRCSISRLLCAERGGSGPQGAGPAEVMAGKQIFHTRSAVHPATGRASSRARTCRMCISRPEIWPYTDLLLHDMGEGLADGRPEGLANGREWRTAPLWGIGLTEVVNGHTFFLHDGRARSIEEAILWHDGEARRARDAFAALSR